MNHTRFFNSSVLIVDMIWMSTSQKAVIHCFTICTPGFIKLTTIHLRSPFIQKTSLLSMHLSLCWIVLKRNNNLCSQVLWIHFETEEIPENDSAYCLIITTNHFSNLRWQTWYANLLNNVHTLTDFLKGSLFYKRWFF